MRRPAGPPGWQPTEGCISALESAADGHETRQNNTLLSYTKCNAEQVQHAIRNAHITRVACLLPGGHARSASHVLAAGPTLRLLRSSIGPAKAGWSPG